MKNRLEELFDSMVDEAPVMFTQKMKPYILEFARIYEEQSGLEKLKLLERVLSVYDYDLKNKGTDEYNLLKEIQAITNPKNIKLD